MNINLFNKTRYHKFIIINILLFLITNVSNLMSNSTLKIVLSSNNNKNYKFRNKYINKGNCFLIDKNLTNLFKLNSLNFTIDNPYTDTKIFINFCEDKNIKNPDPALIKIKINSEKGKGKKIESKIISLYNNSYKTKLWYYDNTNRTLKIKLLTNQICKDNRNLNNINISLIINCDESKNGTFYENSPEEIFNIIENENICNKKIKFFSNDLLCPKKANFDLHKFYLKYNYIFGLNYIIWGFFMLTYGNLFEYIIIYLNGILFSRMVFLLIEDFLFSLFSSGVNNNEWMIWTTEIIIIIVAYFLSNFTKKSKNLKYILLGSLIGSILSYYNWLIFCLYIKDYQKTFYYINNCLGIILGSIISYKFFVNSQNYLIISCAIVGSYNIIMGIAYYLEVLFSDSYYLMMLINHEYETVEEVI
jgi:hypothetical protein